MRARVSNFGREGNCRPRQYSPRLILGLVAKNCITGPISSSSFSAFKGLSPPSLRGGIDGRRKLLLSKRGVRGGREEGEKLFYGGGGGDGRKEEEERGPFSPRPIFWWRLSLKK